MSTVKADRPWDHIAMDFIGKLPASEKGFVFILIIVDVLTRFVVLRPLMRKDVKTVALELVNLFVNFGVAKIIQSDNESTFVSELLEELRGLMGFKARRVMMKTRGVQVCFRRRRKTKSFGNPEKAKAENSGRLGDCGCSIKRY